jgi:23S rRNA G2445 N2-methylase RlmL
MDGKNKTEVVAGWNKARNSLKHRGRTDDEFVVLNTCDEAYWMIKRALDNAKRLGVVIPNEHDFENWVVINVNM